ncbi:MAG: M55 family metallopeptidase [Bacillota bacterium]
MENQDLSVFISADMEGISSLVAGQEVSKGEDEYKEFREIMTGDVNAAVGSAFANGATRVVVRDAHATARNILPDKLDERAELIRGWSGRPYSMMDGINENFDTVFLVGYHSSPGLEDGTLAHTISGKFHKIYLNEQPASEALINAYTAGYFGVPVSFISGDETCCQQTEELIPGIETAVVKYGLGGAIRALPLGEARRRIKIGVKSGLGKMNKLKPLGASIETFNAHLIYRRIKDAIRAGNYPGAEQKDYEVKFVAEDYLEFLTFLHFVS